MSEARRVPVALAHVVLVEPDGNEVVIRGTAVQASIAVADWTVPPVIDGIRPPGVQPPGETALSGGTGGKIILVLEDSGPASALRLEWI